MRFRKSYNQTSDFEINAEFLGMISLPLIVLGIIFIAIPDVLYEIWQHPRGTLDYRTTNKKLSRWLEITMKVFGWVLVVIGISFFFFSKTIFGWFA